MRKTLDERLAGHHGGGSLRELEQSQPDALPLAHLAEHLGLLGKMTERRVTPEEVETYWQSMPEDVAEKHLDDYLECPW